MARRTLQSVRSADAAAGRWEWLRAGLALASVVPVVLEHGWLHRLLAPGAGPGLVSLCLGLYCAATLRQAWLHSRGGGTLGREMRRHQWLLGLALAGAALSWWTPAMVALPTLLMVVHALYLFQRLVTTRIPPGLVFVGSFGVVISVGAGLLMLPAATPPESPVGALDALFTATSAVCVTGLIVRDTASEFTRFGQGVILVLMQLGGMGILFFGALLAMAMGSSLGMRAIQATGHTSEGGVSGARVRRLLMFIGAATLVAEAAGAAALYFGWPATWEGAPAMATAGDRIFHSVFFSVSGFCNAGFATSPNSLEGLRHHWTSLVVMAGLITIGGLGFPALNEVRRTVWRRVRRRDPYARRGPERMNLHARLVLTTSLCLYLAGVAGIALGRLTHGDTPALEALADAHFMSVTARTAGFDTVAPAALDGFGRFGLMLLMFIGGSPGSTAGGVKTIVVAVLLVSVWATIRGREQAEVFRRSIPDEAVKRAGTLIVLGLATITAVAGALIAFEGHKFDLDDLIFEAVSACGTVGLSTGVTAGLGSGGKVAVIVGMFLGRVGPLAVLVALLSVAARRRPKYAYPPEPVQMS